MTALYKQKENANLQNLKYKLKIAEMVELFKVAASEQILEQEENKMLVDELVAENQKLRDILKISESF